MPQQASLSGEPRQEPHRPRPRWLAICHRLLIAEPMQRAECEVPASRDGDAATAEPRLDLKVSVAFIVAAISLTLLEYLVKSGPSRLTGYLDAVGLTSPAAWLHQTMGESPAQQFHNLAYFSLGCTTVYFLLPALTIKLAFRHRLRDYGLKLNGMFKDAWMYGLMLCAVGPAVFLASFTAPFQAKYPFYHLQEGEPFWPYFYAWEVLYAVQFVALEFFFRGFLVHGTRRRLGYYSIFAMMIPYCMIHFGKPMLETFAAIIAGIVLGIMSLRTRSIWMGAGLHITVAWLMDTLALWQKSLLF